MKRAFAALILALALLPHHKASAAEACAHEGKVHYLCGPKNAEDLARIPGTPYLAVSGMSSGKGGALYLVDASRRTAVPLAVDYRGRAQRPYDRCPGPPASLEPHGLALRPGKGGRHLLYAVNHGGRQSVELFEVDAASGPPKARWIGCVVMPADMNPNSVAPTPEGGFVVTKFDANDRTGFPAMAAGKLTGAVFEWAPGKGLRELPGTALSGDNGIEVSPDGRWIYVNAWGEGRVVRFWRQGGGGPPPASAKLDFLPDNIHWGPNGQLLVTGQVADIRTLFSCEAGRCPHDWAVVRLDPATMRVRPLVREPGTAAFSDATGALQVGDEVWAGTYRGDRLAVVPVK